MSLFSFLSGSTPAGIISDAGSKVVGTVFDGISSIIKDFHLAPDDELKFKQRMLELQTEAQLTVIKDTMSARDMQIATKSWVPGALTVLVTLGYFCMLGYIIHYGLPHVVGQVGGEALFMLIQTLATGFGMMLQFWFGSTMSSQQKDNYLFHSQPSAPVPANGAPK